MRVVNMFTLKIGKVAERLRLVDFKMKALWIPLPIQCWLLHLLKLTLNRQKINRSREIINHSTHLIPQGGSGNIVDFKI